MTRTILIVDDNKFERTLLSNLLKHKYDILMAADGGEMLTVLSTYAKSISAVFLDLMMPDIDGFEMLSKMRENEIYRQIPVIVTTGLTDEESQVKAMSLGASGYVFKPYNKDLLYYTLSNVINLREKSALLNALKKDSLTGLMNRRSFLESAEDVLFRKEAGYYTLDFLNVENFKVINEQYGTSTGDAVLKEIASKIIIVTQELEGICCRYTADKFCLLYPSSCMDSDKITELHKSICDCKGINKKLIIRIGRYLADDLSVSVSTMCDRASTAETSIKGRFDTFIAYYTETMRDSILREQKIVNDMTGALNNGEFEPWYQPQYNHYTGAIIGAEALVRWKKDGKYISPADFIPVFERNGFIYDMDKYIWRQVCKQMRCWIDEGKNPLPVSINISRRDLFHQHFISVLTEIIKEYDLPYYLIRLEVTESTLADKSIVQKVDELIKLGFTVEIDDFGSGYSSLNTLKDVPASILKLDMKFFENTGDTQRGGNIVESVVRMAKWLGMAVIAEGVENKAQADYLKTIGCYYIQGYFYAKPMPAAEYEKLFINSEKELQLTRLQTLETLDNNEFWDPQSMDTLIFNSYVGAACILELTKDRIEMIRATDKYVEMLGSKTMRVKDVLNLDWIAFMDEKNICQFKNAVTESVETKKTITGEFTFNNLPGCPRKVYLSAGLRAIATVGERILIYVLNTNITAQRLAEQETLEASERVNAVMDNSHCGITAVAIHDDETVEYLFVNNRFYEILGYTKHQFEAEVNDPFGCILPEEYGKITRATLNLKGVGNTVTLQMRAIRRDKAVIWLRCDISIVKFANVSDTVQLSSFLDITDQIENEMKQLENAQKLEVITGNVNGGVSAIQISEDATSTSVFNNEKYYELYGYTREQAEAENLDVMTLIVPEDIDYVMEKIRKLKKDKQPTLIDYRIKKPNGRLAQLRANASLMTIPGYNNDVITSVVTDITEKKSLEEQLHSIVDNIYGGVSASYIKNGIPNFVIVNNKFFENRGYKTREEFEILCKNDKYAGIHPDDKERIRNQFVSSDGGKKQYSMHYRIIRKDGEVRHILNNISVINLFGIDTPVCLSVENDITEQRMAEIKEHNLSLQLQAIMANIHGGITATLYHNKNDIEVIFSNDGFYQLYGYTKEQFADEVPNMLDLILPEDRKQTMDTVAHIFENRGSETYEYRCRKRDGSIMWTKCTNTVISIDGVGDTILLAATSDVTDLREAQREQLETTDRLKTVMNVMHSGMTAVAFHGDRTDFLFANNRYYEIHGFRKNLIHQENFADALEFVYPDDREMIRNTVLDAAKTKQTTSAEYRIIRPDGKIRWIKTIINVTNLLNIDVPVQVTVYTDITEMKEANDQLRFLNSSAHDIMAQPDCDKAINDTIKKMLDYFSADRSYVVELDYAKNITNNTYEICADGIESKIDNLKSIPFTSDNFWFASLSNDNFLVIDDVDKLGGKDESQKQMLKSQGINSIVLAPLWRDGRLIGFLGADNPSCATEQISQLTALADYVTFLLTRRDMNRKITHDMNAIHTLMSDTPGGFLRMKIHQDKNPTVENFNEGFCQLLGITSDEVWNAFGDDAYKCLVSEDIAQVTEETKDAFETCGKFTCRCRMHKKNGDLMWVTVFGRFVRGENNGLFLNSYFTDITEQKRAEELQLEMLDNLPFSAGMYEFDGKNLTPYYINKQYEVMVSRSFNSSNTELKPIDYIHPEDRALVYEELEDAIANNRRALCDIRLQCGKDKYTKFHLDGNIRKQGNGKYMLYVAFLHNSN